MHQVKLSKVTTLLFIIIITASSCTVVGTLYPVFNNEKDFVLNKGLEGRWIDPTDRKSYLLIKANEDLKQYDIFFINSNQNKPEDTAHFKGHLIANNDSYYLECWYNVESEIGDLVVARHFMIKAFFLSKNKIEFGFPDAERLIQLINEKKLQLQYAELEENSQPKNTSFLILDKSPVLQKAFMDMKKYPELFKDKVTLTRSK